MKHIMLGIFLIVVLSETQASAIEIKNASVVNFSGYNGQPRGVTGAHSTGVWGSLHANSSGKFSATYLGNESGYVDSFSLGSGDSLQESNKVGDTISMKVDAGLVNFSFSDNAGGGHTFVNGQSQEPVFGFAILNGQTNKYGAFDFLLGFNDSYRGDGDYDDFVVGVNLISAVPEPETYAMLLIGLGLICFTARRRKLPLKN